MQPASKSEAAHANYGNPTVQPSRSRIGQFWHENGVGSDILYKHHEHLRNPYIIILKTTTSTHQLQIEYIVMVCICMQISGAMFCNRLAKVWIIAVLKGFTAWSPQNIW